MVVGSCVVVPCCGIVFGVGCVGGIALGRVVGCGVSIVGSSVGYVCSLWCVGVGCKVSVLVCC